MSQPPPPPPAVDAPAGSTVPERAAAGTDGAGRTPWRPGPGGSTDLQPVPANPALERRAALMLLLLVGLLAVSALYLLYARGAFEPTQRLTLVAEDSEGVSVGMDVTFSGFPIGRVGRITLGDDGQARILVEVPRADARWLRTSSVFTLTRSLVGGTAIKAYSGILSDPPLPDGAERPVLIGDATAEIPRLLASVKDLVGNLNALTAADAALAGTLGNLRSATGQLGQKGGALGVLTGSPDTAAQLGLALDRANALLLQLDALARRTQGVMGRVDGVVGRVDGAVQRADEKLLGQGGLVDDTQATVRTLQALLNEARASLQRVDAVLADAQAISGQARLATEDLGALRAEVDASLRKVQQLVNDVQRRWPFASDTTLRLP